LDGYLWLVTVLALALDAAATSGHWVDNRCGALGGNGSEATRPEVLVKVLLAERRIAGGRCGIGMSSQVDVWLPGRPRDGL
jgi:hypothetical protein